MPNQKTLDELIASWRKSVKTYNGPDKTKSFLLNMRAGQVSRRAEEENRSLEELIPDQEERKLFLANAQGFVVIQKVLDDMQEDQILNSVSNLI